MQHLTTACMSKASTRKELLTYVADKITRIQQHHPVRVAIDGFCAAGKTMLANELSGILRSTDRQIIRISADDFHNPREIRYRQGRNSGEGYYRDAFDHAAIIEHVLKPLGAGGGWQYRRATLDFMSDVTVVVPAETANQDAILLMDGVFLFRPELIHSWDFKIFIDVDFKITVQRAVKRDGYYLGSEQEILEKYNQRYIPGQRIYVQEVKPLERADIVIDNNDFESPVIVSG